MPSWDEIVFGARDDERLTPRSRRRRRAGAAARCAPRSVSEPCWPTSLRALVGEPVVVVRDARARGDEDVADARRARRRRPGRTARRRSPRRARATQERAPSAARQRVERRSSSPRRPRRRAAAPRLPADVPHAVDERRRRRSSRTWRWRGTSTMPWSAVTSDAVPRRQRRDEGAGRGITGSSAAIHSSDCQPRVWPIASSRRVEVDESIPDAARRGLRRARRARSRSSARDGTRRRAASRAVKPVPAYSALRRRRSSDARRRSARSGVGALPVERVEAVCPSRASWLTTSSRAGIERAVADDAVLARQRRR